MTKLTVTICNICKQKINDKTGHGFAIYSSEKYDGFDDRDLTLVKLQDTDKHVCIRCIREIGKVKL